MRNGFLSLCALVFSFHVFCQTAKVNAYDKFLKKQRIEMQSVALSGLKNKDRLSINYSAIGSALYLTMTGSGWGTSTIDNGNELILLFSNDSTATLTSTSLQGFEPGMVQSTYKHQYFVRASDLEMLSKLDLVSVRKYSFKNFSDLRVPRENATKIRNLSAAFMKELKQAKLFQNVIGITTKEIQNHIGDSVQFCSKVYKTRYFQTSENGPTLLDVQADFSDPYVNIVILEGDRSNFNNAPEKRYLNKDVCISGVVRMRNNFPYIVIHDKKQIQLKSPIGLDEVELFAGDSVTVSGKVFTARYLDDSKTKPTLLNLGAPFPNQLLTLVIDNENRSKFGSPEAQYSNKTVRVSGVVSLFKSKPQIVLTSKDQIKVIDDDNSPVALSAVQTDTVSKAMPAVSKQFSSESVTEAKDEESLPEFPGGQTAFLAYLRKNLVNPDELGLNEYRKVVATFEIDTKGDCGHIKIIESAGTAFDAEVKRVLSRMPQWKPAMKNGVSVAKTYRQPITFFSGDPNAQ